MEYMSRFVKKETVASDQRLTTVQYVQRKHELWQS